MRPQLGSLTSQCYDLIVVGGGINGVAAAWDAAERGLSVLLIERKDFGSGASHGCFRIAHGGLRYLQHLDFRRLKESVSEQRFLRTAGTHLVAPFPFLVPCYGYGMRGRELLRLGLSLYESIGSMRNSGLPQELRLPAHRVLSPQECLQLAPHLRQQGLRGGVIYYDCQLSSADRLTIEVALAAQKAGALLRNYTEAVRFRAVRDANNGWTIDSLIARDLLTGEHVEVRGREFVFACGVHNERLEALVHSAPLERSRVFSKGLQVLLPAIVQDVAVALESSWSDPGAVVARGNRSYFLMPWHGQTIAGTMDIAHRVDPDKYQLDQEETASFVNELKEQYPDQRLSVEAVRAVFGGLRPIDVATENNSIPAVSRRDLVIDHRQFAGDRRIANLVTSEGVKYTTFRLIAEWVVDKVISHLGRSGVSTTGSKRLPYADDKPPHRFQGFEKLTSAATHSAATHGAASRGADGFSAADYENYLHCHFGTAAAAIARLADSNPILDEQVVETHPAKWAEILYSYRCEMPATLADVFYRRSVLGSLGLVTPPQLQQATEVIGQLEDWSPERRELELRLAMKERSPFIPQSA